MNVSPILQMENKGSGVCEKRTAKENYAYDQENAVRNDVVFTLLNARVAMNDTTRFDPVAQARYESLYRMNTNGYKLIVLRLRCY